MHKRQDPPPQRCPDKHDNEFVCTYDYRGEFGNLQFQKARYRYFYPEAAGRSKTFRYWRPGVYRGQGWEWGKPTGADDLLYRLPGLLAAIRAGARQVLVCEGEKDADTAFDRGLIATTAHQGGGPGNKVTAEQAAWFMGYSGSVVIVADRDTTGYATAWRWYQQLIAQAALRPEQFRVVVSRVGKDLAEHYERGGGKRWHTVNLKRLERVAAQWTDEVGTREGYAPRIDEQVMARKSQDALQQELMANGYGRGAALRLAWRLV